MFSRFSELSHFINKTKFTIPSYSIRFFNRGRSKKTKLELEVKKLKSSRNNDNKIEDYFDVFKENLHNGSLILAGIIISYSVARILMNVNGVKGIRTISPDQFQNEYLINRKVSKVNMFGPISKLLSGVVAEIILHPGEDQEIQKLALIGCTTNEVGFMIKDKESQHQIPKQDGLIPISDLSEFCLLIAFILLQWKFVYKSQKFFLNGPKGKFEVLKISEIKKLKIPKNDLKGIFDQYVDPKKLPRFHIHIQKSDIKFKDVARLHNAKEEAKLSLDYLNNPARFIEELRLPRGALLFRTPGCSKTLLVRALSNESNVPFFYNDLIVGAGAKSSRNLFGSAKRVSPAIIYLDEINAIGKKRGSDSQFDGYNDLDQILNKLLMEMYGMDPNAGVIAATNRADVLNSALTRPGRFDRNILIDLPVLEERKEIFEHYLKKNENNLDTDLLQLRNKWPFQTPGMSGADIANLCIEAALTAAKYDYTTIKTECFDIALERIVSGALKKNKILFESERKLVAYHEACHWLLKMSILPRTYSSLGFSQLTPLEKYLQTTEMLNDQIAVLMGGRAAESILFNSKTSDSERIAFARNPKIFRYSKYD